MDAENNKPKTVTTIDIQLPPSVSRKEWLAESVEEHFHCILCGSELVFQHKTDFINQTVSEAAHCPSCNVRNRQGEHRLQ